MDLNDKLIQVHFKLFRSIKSEFKHEAPDLTFQQLSALIFLKEKQKSSVGDIAKFFNTAIPTTTALLKRLYEMGLIRRHEDEKDRRITRIFISKKAEDLLERKMKHRAAIMKRVLSKLSSADKEQLLKIMTKLTI